MLAHGLRECHARYVGIPFTLSAVRVPSGVEAPSVDGLSAPAMHKANGFRTGFIYASSLTGREHALTMHAFAQPIVARRIGA